MNITQCQFAVQLIKINEIQQCFVQTAAMCLFIQARARAYTQHLAGWAELSWVELVGAGPMEMILAITDLRANWIEWLAITDRFWHRNKVIIDDHKPINVCNVHVRINANPIWNICEFFFGFPFFFYTLLFNAIVFWLLFFRLKHNDIHALRHRNVCYENQSGRKITMLNNETANRFSTNYNSRTIRNGFQKWMQMVNCFMMLLDKGVAIEVLVSHSIPRRVSIDVNNHGKNFNSSDQWQWNY